MPDGFSKRVVPLPFAVLVLLICGVATYTAGYNNGATDEQERCTVLTLEGVQHTLGRPDTTVLVNDSTCLFNSGSHAIVGVTWRDDKDRSVYNQNMGVINAEKASGVDNAFWGAKHDSIFLWKNQKFVAINGDSSLTDQDYLDLAIMATHNI